MNRRTSTFRILALLAATGAAAGLSAAETTKEHPAKNTPTREHTEPTLPGDHEVTRSATVEMQRAVDAWKQDQQLKTETSLALVVEQLHWRDLHADNAHSNRIRAAITQVDSLARDVHAGQKPPLQRFNNILTQVRLAEHPEGQAYGGQENQAGAQASND